MDADAVRTELKRLAQANLEHATFLEKREMLNKLDIKVFPSENLKTMGIKCALEFPAEGAALADEPQQDRCGIVGLACCAELELVWTSPSLHQGVNMRQANYRDKSNSKNT